MLAIPYPVRFTAIKLIERDPAMVKIVKEQDLAIVATADRLAGEIETIHGESVCVVMSAERYQVADRIAAEVITMYPLSEGPQKKSLTDQLDRVALHPFLGYLAVIARDWRVARLDICDRRPYLRPHPVTPLAVRDSINR